MSRPRTCFYIDETMWTPMGYIPSVVTEGEPGFAPLAGDPEKGQAPWYWGTDLQTARFITRKANQEKGLTDDDVREIVTSSIAASNAEPFGLDLVPDYVPDHLDRHDEDGKAYIAYFRRSPMMHFIWSGSDDDPVQVTHGESGEPITDTFVLPWVTLRVDWAKAFNDLKAADLEHDADDPIAARYRDTSAAVNHSNRKREAQSTDEALRAFREACDEYIEREERLGKALRDQ